jgi:hypothetical protein
MTLRGLSGEAFVKPSLLAFAVALIVSTGALAEQRVVQLTAPVAGPGFSVVKIGENARSFTPDIERNTRSMTADRNAERRMRDFMRQHARPVR